MSPAEVRPFGSPPEQSEKRFDSWKEIAAYLGRDIRTVQRWETTRGLPVHRLPGAGRGAVCALRSEIDQWSRSRGDLPEEAPAPVVSRRLVYAALAVVLVAACAVGLMVLLPYFRPSEKPSPPPRVLRLTRLPGSESYPAFSPDEQRIAFSWNGGVDGENYDIYVKLLDLGDPVRLTTDPTGDWMPAWAPDGRRIAFLRWALGAPIADLYVVPSMGGAERKVLTFHLVTGATPPFPIVSWTPDGKRLITSYAASPQPPWSLVSVSPETGERKPVTSPPEGSVGDHSPVISQDGRRLAFLRTTSGGISNVFLLDLLPDYSPAAPPRQITAEPQGVTNPFWNADGTELFYRAGRGDAALMRLDIRSVGEPRAIETIGELGGHLTLSRSGKRLAYTDNYLDEDIWRWDLRKDAPVRFLSSSAADRSAQLSPDRSRVAFISSREGSPAIWIADADGRTSRELVRLPNEFAGGPRWSAASDEIVYECRIEADNEDICVISADGGPPQRLSSDKARDILPSWSADGRSIYFSSNRSGAYQIWKAPAANDARQDAVQVTSAGGYGAAESPDGRYLYYTKAWLSGQVCRMPTGGGKEEMIGQTVRSLRMPQNFAVSTTGVYYTTSSDPWKGFDVQFLDLGSRRTITLGHVRASLGNGMSLVPGLDGAPAEILFSAGIPAGGDLILVENFR